MKKVWVVILVLVGLFFAGVIVSLNNINNQGSCLDSSTFIESYWSYALRLDFWNVAMEPKVLVCTYGCFEGRCLTAEEKENLKLPSAPDLPPEPSHPVDLG